MIQFTEKCRHLLPTNCPLPYIVCAIIDFILKYFILKFMDTHIHEVLGISIGTWMAPPYASLFMDKEQRMIFLNFLNLIYFWKCFIDDIFFILLSFHSQLKSLMTFMNTVNPAIKYTFTYSEQTVSFLDMQIYLSESRKLKKKLYQKAMGCIALLHFHYYHPLSCKEGVVYFPSMRYNIIISEDHILQDEINNLIGFLLAPTYPLHLIMKNI